jgi:hypothetical protein
MIRTICVAAALLAVSVASFGEAAPAAKAGDLVFATGFEEPAAMEGWSVRGGTIDAGYESAKALCVTPAAGPGNSASIERPLAVERVPLPQGPYRHL